MALPLIAAGIAARAVASKLATRAAGGIVGAGAKSVNPVYKNIGSSVKVKPAAKQKPNRPNETKAFSKADSTMGRSYNKAAKEYDSMPEAGRFGSAAERQAMANEIASKSPIGRKTSIAIKKLTDAEKRKATTPSNINTANPFAKRIKINSALPKRGK